MAELARVVITGMGVVSPIGNDLPSFWSNLIAGNSGGGLITKFDTTHFATKIACELKGFPIENYLDRKEINKTDPFIQYAVAASDEAIKQASFNFDTTNRDRVGVIWASGNGGVSTFDKQLADYFTSNQTSKFSPYFMPKILVDIAAGYIAMRHQLRGVNYCPVSACASGTTAIIDAYNYLRLNMADIIIAGASEAPITPSTILGFGAMKALSTNNSNPLSASCPFDKNRDGFVMGEGAGALILETLEHAQKRGATIYAEVVGVGMSADAYHLTATHPDGLGARLAMQQALTMANVSKEQIDLVNMHATSTPVGDLSELKAMELFFEEHIKSINFSATKSVTGHLLGATGAVEAIACVQSIQTNIIPPTINNVQLDYVVNPSINLTLNKAQHKNVNYALSNNFGFGGHNASLLLKKFE